MRFRADRWYPVANMTIQHRMRVYDYYEPGKLQFHNILGIKKIHMRVGVVEREGLMIFLRLFMIILLLLGCSDRWCSMFLVGYQQSTLVNLYGTQ